MGKTNTGLTYLKFIIPIITILILLLVFHPSNYTTPSFMPYGSAPMIMSISTTGIVFSYLGFRQGLEFAGEAKNPKKDVPLGTILGFVLGIIIYVLLQTAFIGSISWTKLGLAPGNWSGLGTTSIAAAPFYVAAKLSSSSIAKGWAWGIMVGAIVAPIGTALIYLGTVSRVMYGMSTNGHLPEHFMRLNKYKIPWLGLILSWLIGSLYFLPFPSWAYIAGITVFATVFTYTIGGVAVPALRRIAPDMKKPFALKAPYIMGLIAFISAFLIVYWAGFSTMWVAAPLVLAGLPIFYMYVMPKQFNANKSLGIIFGIIYWIILALTTYFLIYKPIVLPWASLGYGNTLQMNSTYNIDFWAFIIINLVTSVGMIYTMSYNNKEALKEINAGIWTLTTLFIGLILVFYGNLGPFAKPLLPFPYDNVAAIVAGVIIFFIAERSAYLTEELQAIMNSMKEP